MTWVDLAERFLTGLRHRHYSHSAVKAYTLWLSRLADYAESHGLLPADLGPEYADATSLLRTHINNACHEKNTIAHALFGTEPLDPKQMYEDYARAAEQVAPFVADTAVMLNQAFKNGEKIMFEGAQGALLDIDHGTYPFVTSSSSTAGGAVTGTGVGPTSIGTVIAVTKAYVTRVGEGPFPTEIHDESATLLRARGAGDVKLLAMLAAWLGLRQTGLVLFLAVVAGALYGLATILLNRSGKTSPGQLPVPFGTMLSAAGLYSIFLGEWTLGWYAQFFH